MLDFTIKKTTGLTIRKSHALEAASTGQEGSDE